MFLNGAQTALWTRTENRGGAEIRSVWYGFLQCLRYRVQKFLVFRLFFQHFFLLGLHFLRCIVLLAQSAWH